MNLPLALYRGVTGLLEPWVPSLLTGRAKRGKEDVARIGERLGKASRPRPDGNLVWLHGVSVGESLSLLPLVLALRAARPDLALLVTSGTRTSADLLAQRLPPGVVHQYAPVDTPGAVARFLDYWRPSLGVFVESELWPNLILAVRARGVKLALMSARMTQASAEGWGHIPGTARTLLSAFDLILPQDAEISARLAKLRAKIQGHLNLKRLGEPLPYDQSELSRLRADLVKRSVILASNTHPGEDEMIVKAVSGLGALLVITPRHPERGGTIAAELTGLGLKVARRSLGEALTPDSAVYLADTLGEMGLFYSLADVAVMGGSFVAGIGGHNPLEPARLGVPVVTGPYVFNAAELYDEMFGCVAAMPAADAETLTRHLKGLMANPQIRRQMSDAGLAYAARQGATLEAALDLLNPLLPA